MANKNKNNFLYIGIAVVVVIVLAIVFISNSNNNSQNEVTCNSPYIKVGTECCLDQNSNNICDNDETPTQPQEYCGDNICQSNEKAPDCEDCNSDIRIENVKYEIIPDPNQPEDWRRLAITNYDVIQLGDKVVVYPGFDLYAGYSDIQCNSKDKMNAERLDIDCPGGCYYVVDGDKKGKTYQEDGWQLINPENDFTTPNCIYFVLELKPYPQDGIGYGDNPSPIATWESPIINI
jgi:hypothetical protein